MKLVIVGGVAGGATAAARARRIDETAEIVVFERGADVSFANCGLPYHIGGEIQSRSALIVQTKMALEHRFALDIRTRCEVVFIDRQAKTVEVRDLDTGRTYSEKYDKLLLSPGAKPFIPRIPGADSPNVFTLRDLADTDRIKEAVDAGAKEALIIGGGFIGLEMAENLRRRGLDVALVELMPQVMPVLDSEIAALLEQELRSNGVKLFLGTSIEEIIAADSKLEARLKSGIVVKGDLILFAAGVQPESNLARDAGLELGLRGAIAVNEHLQTSDADIYAVGDAIQFQDAIFGTPAFVPLAGPANRQARVAVDHIFGRQAAYRGLFGTSIVRVFGLAAGVTGATEKTLQQKQARYSKVYVHRSQHAGYFPGAVQVTIKLMFCPETGRILGAEIAGRDGVDKRLDVMATALYSGLSVADLENLELAYAPQFGAAKDPINIAGYVANNVLHGEERLFYPEHLEEGADHLLLDVREPEEFLSGHIPGAMNIPLGKLRQESAALLKDKPIVVYCGVGQRGYYAERILRARGFDVFNLSGGYTTYKLFSEEPSVSLTSSKETEKGPTNSAEAEGLHKIDLSGLQCPGPIAKLTAEAKGLAPGSIIAAVSSDPGFEADIKAWSAACGHEFLGVEKEAGRLSAKVRVSGGNRSIPLPPSARKKTFVVFSGDLDRVLAAFILANAAADMKDSVTVFFTFWGLNALRKNKVKVPDKTMLEKMFCLLMPEGASRLKLSKMNFAGLGTALMKKIMRDKKVQDLPSLILSAEQKGVRLVACSMSMDVMGIKREELLDGVEVAGAAAYLGEANQGGVNLFI